MSLSLAGNPDNRYPVGEWQSVFLEIDLSVDRYSIYWKLRDDEVIPVRVAHNATFLGGITLDHLDRFTLAHFSPDPFGEIRSSRSFFDNLRVCTGSVEDCLAPSTRFKRGDTNTDNTIDIADAIFVLSYLFAEGPPPTCLDAADTNDDRAVDIADAVAVLSHLFAGSGDLPEPFGECGVDPTEDELGCLEYPGCE